MGMKTRAGLFWAAGPKKGYLPVTGKGGSNEPKVIMASHENEAARSGGAPGGGMAC